MKECIEHEKHDPKYYETLYNSKPILSQIIDVIFKQRLHFTILDDIERLEAFEDSAYILLQLSRNKHLLWLDSNIPKS
jgi:hypothetical protein